MKRFNIVFAPEAEDDLAALYDYIAEHGSPVVAARYTEAIVMYCESLATFPQRGTKRDDVRLGPRVTNYKRRAVIAFESRQRGGFSIHGSVRALADSRIRVPSFKTETRH